MTLMTPMKYFVYVNLFYVIIVILTILFFPKENIHDGLSMTLLVGEPVTIFFMFVIKKSSNLKSIFV